MNRTPIFALLLLAAACGGQDVPQQQAAENAEAAVEIFAGACDAGKGSAESAAAWAAARQWQPLDAAAVKKLPAGMMEPDAQAVWQGSRNGTVFYLSTAPDACSVKTAVADEAAARKAFAKLAEGGEAAARFRSEHSVSSPFPFRQLVYARLNPDGSEILLTVNTSTSNRVPAQLALHLVRKNLTIQPVTANP